jgi:hypothetical protein
MRKKVQNNLAVQGKYLPLHRNGYKTNTWISPSGDGQQQSGLVSGA